MVGLKLHLAGMKSWWARFTDVFRVKFNSSFLLVNLVNMHYLLLIIKMARKKA